MARNSVFGDPAVWLIAGLGRWIAPPLVSAARLVPRQAPAKADAPRGTPLGRTLAPLTNKLRIVWWLTVLRRALIVGLLAGLVAALMVYGLGWPRWLGVAVTIVVALLASLGNAGQTPGTVIVARYVDQELDLKERIGTALEFEGEVPPHSSLQGLVERSGAEAATGATRSWTARPRATRGEWLVVAVLLAALAWLVSAPPASGSSRLVALVPSQPPIATDQPAIAGPLPTGVKPISVQVAVVSTPASNDSQSGSAAKPQASATARPKTTGTAGRSRVPAPTPTSLAQEPPAPPDVGGKAAFLATTPTTDQSKATPGSGSGKANAAAGTKAGGGKITPSGAPPPGTKAQVGKGQNGNGGASANQPGGKTGSTSSDNSSSGAPKAQQCNLYGCTKVNNSQLAKPGLITGSGQIVGTSKTGGKTAGTGAGSTAKGNAAAVKTPTPSHQLAITSPYGATNSRGSSTRQVQGHNGAGGDQQSVAVAGGSAQPTIDYVAPDDNVISPVDSASVERYFTPAASGQAGAKSS